MAPVFLRLQQLAAWARGGHLRGAAASALGAADGRRLSTLDRSGSGSAARAADPRFRLLFEHSGEGLLVCTPAGQILASNAVAAKLLGAERAALRGSSLVARLQAMTPSVATAAAAAPSASSTAVRLQPGASQAMLADAKGKRLPVELYVSQAEHDGVPQWLVHLRDLSSQRQTEERLSYLANFDSLTGLPNRALFRDRLGGAMERAKRSGQPMALMFLDLDRFKVVNDSLGHETGDRLLKHVATTLTQCLRNVDSLARAVDTDPFTLSRLGGDEFTVIAESVHCAEDAALIAQRMLDALTTPFVAGEEEIYISASIGISMFPTDDIDMDGLIRHADMAMYRSKALGRSTYSFFSDDLNTAVSARLSLEGSLRRALERDEFRLYYQPKADLRTGQVTGVEALLRWQRPDQGMVPPDHFIDVLEDTGLILPVGAWVIRSACGQLAAWDQLGLGPLELAVNLSARQFRHQFLASLVEDTLRENDIDPRRVEFELTESLLMEDTDINRGTLGHFARIGVRVAIDDFGTGHSSLSYLKRFNIDTLKIDRSFVNDLPGDSEDAAIATAIIAMGHSMQMRIVAEGVETQAQADFLGGLGCDSMQGYLLSRPLPADQFAAWLQAHRQTLARRDSDNVFGQDTEAMALFSLEPALVD